MKRKGGKYGGDGGGLESLALSFPRSTMKSVRE